MKYFIYWIAIFWLAKILFILYNFDQSKHLSFGEIVGIFGYGLIMDVSTACYLLIIPGLLVVFRTIISSRFLNRFMWFYTLLFLFITAMLIVPDLGLYPHWGTRVNVTIFNYLKDSVALQSSLTLSIVLLGLFIIAGFIAGFLFLYRKMFTSGLFPEGKINLTAALIQLFLVASLIIPMRGGLDTSPLNLSSVAFSSKLYVNQAATNFLWNFAKSVEKRDRLSNPCIYMSEEESIRFFEEFVKNDTVITRPQLIRLDPEKQPNVILIILESFSNKVIAPLGGLQDITPTLNSLCNTSIVFTNFYAAGNRSDRGISALLGGYPSLLTTSIMVYPEKSQSLTLLPEYFNRKNYRTSFYYGGDINFYNLKTFVLQGKYGKLTTKSDFPAELGRMSKWGVPDSFVFERALEDLKSEQEPFMKTIYTISSHPPYDVPYSKFTGISNNEKYLNSVAYTDSCLGVFIDEFRKSPHWKNTLFIVTSDHGSLVPGPTNITEPASHLIPLIWTGGVVDSLQKIETICQQTDFGTTLIHQLGWETDSAKFSNDFFISNPHAFYILDTGWGYVTSEGNYYFDQGIRNFVLNPANDGKPFDPNFPKAFMQVLHDDFSNK
ncbi:MAG: sulfatase-like hydrolase/transferase [Bacteroidetes bacterium]|nr:sulfatase-like hydrolase/transferase [Bacteroidota bacterium]